MKKTVIFDVDGTLYNQRAVRINMAIELMIYYLLHPFSVGELYGIYQFRKYREKSDFSNFSFDELSDYIARKYRINSDSLASALKKWLFLVPIKYIKKYKRTEVLDFMEKSRAGGSQIVIYSDYRADEKLEGLGVSADFVFYPDSESFTGLKPNKAAMEYIVAAADIDCSNLTYVGDRYEKDGISAKFVGAVYLDVKDMQK